MLPRTPPPGGRSARLRSIPATRPERLAGAVVLMIALAIWMAADPASALGATSHEVPELSVVSAVILGLVEGLTEYLPVSSTGHLVVTYELLGLATTPEAEQALDTYAICIQAGAILAVFVLYRERMVQMLEGLLGRSDDGRRVLFGVMAAFVPTAIIGLALVDVVRDRLFGVPPIATAWLVGGLAILTLTQSGVLQRAGRALTEITVRQAVLIGLAQSIALWPGVSRSLITIVAGVLVGLSLSAAVEFSFLLGLATLGAATVVTAASDGGQLIDLFGWFTPLVGLVVAFVAAVASIRWMVSWLQQRSLDVFGFYRIAVGLLAFGLVAAEAL
ncbi:MAG: undecaprenyl-diphosphate phosphatase [Acidimicrobiia bacterium]|nr:undecaprenyl-diphosphate phosphatase [Acidimicrobiia bacterium]